MINEINRVIVESVNSFNLNMKKATSLFEASKRELEINYNQAELKVLNENGTDKDLGILRKAAEKEFDSRAIESIKKTWDATLEFLKNIFEKSNKIIDKAENKEAISKLAQIAKTNPEIGKIKVTIPDINKINKACDAYNSSINTLLAKASGGNDISEDLSEARKNFGIAYKNAINNKDEISVSKAMSDVKSISGDLNKIYQAAVKDTNSFFTKLINIIQKNPELSTYVSGISNEAAYVEKIRMQGVLSYITDSISTVKNAGKKAPKKETVKESTFDTLLSSINQLVFEAEDNADVNPTEIAGDNSDPSGDTGHDTNTNNTASESGPDIDDDPWTDVIEDDPEEDLPENNDYSYDDSDFECGNNCGGYGCATEGYSDKFGEIIEDICKCGLGSKPSNESILSGLYGNLGRGQEVEDKGKLVKEGYSSKFAEIIEDIDKAGLGSKPSNESILSGLYGNLGRGQEVEDKGKLTKESAFESLLNSIHNI